MNKTAIVFLVIGCGFLVWLYFSKRSGTDQEITRLNNKIDSLSNASEQWRMKAAEYFQAYSTSETNGRKMEQRFNYIREENEKLKRRPVLRYSNAQLDSALSARYPK